MSRGKVQCVRQSDISAEKAYRHFNMAANRLNFFGG